MHRHKEDAVIIQICSLKFIRLRRLIKKEERNAFITGEKLNFFKHDSSRICIALRDTNIKSTSMVDKFVSSRLPIKFACDCYSRYMKIPILLHICDIANNIFVENR